MNEDLCKKTKENELLNAKISQIEKEVCIVHFYNIVK